MGEKREEEAASEHEQHKPEIVMMSQRNTTKEHYGELEEAMNRTVQREG